MDEPITNDGGVQDITPQTDGEFMKETIEFIKEANSQDIVNEPVSEPVVGDEPVVSEIDIPDDFTSAAASAGMSEQDIIDFANERTNEELLELIPYLRDGVEEPVEELIEEPVVEEPVVEEVPKDGTPDPSELEQQITERITKELMEKFGDTLEDINQFKEHQAEKEAEQMKGIALKRFDEASERFPIFGKTEELPKFTAGKLAGQPIPTSPAMKARLEVCKYADAFMGLGQNIDEAMDNALATYKGKHLEKDLERNLIKDLKRHESKLSGSRTAREVKRTYADSREEMIDEIRQMQQAAGKDV
jgi:hypothetical protein